MLAAAALIGAAIAALAPTAHAYTVTINPGSRMLFLQVGTGTMSGGTFNSGGTPGNNATVNQVWVTVPGAALGSGAAQAMSTDSTVTASPWDGYAFCNAPASTGQVYVGGFYRVPGLTGSAATLTVTTPSSLTNAQGATLSFSTIAWTSSGNGDAGTTLPSGSFVGGSTQSLLSVTRNTWFESCLAFRYLNTQVVRAGTFKGTAVYTLSAP